MDASLVAVALNHATRIQRSTWQQRAMSNVLERWETERSADFERILYNKDSGWLIEFWPQSNGLGQYGWDSNFTLEVRLDYDLLEQTDNTDEYARALEDYCDAVEDELCEVVGEVQSQTLFSEKEFVAFLLYQRDTVDEQRAADALEVTVGTYRGKLGRIREKIDSATATIDLMGNDVVERDDDRDRAGPFGDLVHVFEADEYPANGARRDDLRYLVQNIVNVQTHDGDPVHYKTVLEEIQKQAHEDVSRYRAKYELEQVIAKGLVERDGKFLTPAE